VKLKDRPKLELSARKAYWVDTATAANNNKK